MYEPAAAATDWLLTAVCAALGAWCATRRRRPWAAAYAVLSSGAAAGALYHGELKPTRHEPAAWTAVSFLVAAGMLALYLASAAELGALRRRSWAALGALSAAALAGGLAGGLRTLGPLVATQAGAMGGIVALWTRAWRAKEPGAAWFCGAMAASAAAAAVRALPVEFRLFWVWNHDALYHLAQIPGLLLIARGVHARSEAATNDHPLGLQQ
ncbi:MAG: hypothetical protein RMK15_04090 [Chloroflexota bacterium]|nr:hypothetical protein [Chloroflexota bacterium]